MASSPRAAWRGPGAAISAHGSAWWRISPPTGTSTGWSSSIRLTMLSPGMSSAVTTTTRFQSKASSSSMPSRRACGSVDRIVAPNQAPGKTRSSAYFAVPVSLAGPSRRSGDAGRARPGAGHRCGRMSGVVSAGAAAGVADAGRRGAGRSGSGAPSAHRTAPGRIRHARAPRRSTQRAAWSSRGHSARSGCSSRSWSARPDRLSCSATTSARPRSSRPDRQAP